MQPNWLAVCSLGNLRSNWRPFQFSQVPLSYRGKESLVLANVVKFGLETNEDGYWFVIYYRFETSSRVDDLVLSGQAVSIVSTKHARNAIATISDEVFDILPWDRRGVEYLLLRT